MIDLTECGRTCFFFLFSFFFSVPISRKMDRKLLIRCDTFVAPDRRKTGRGCPYPRIGEAIIGERRTAPISTVQKETISTVPSLLQKQGASPWELYREQQTGEVEKNPWLAGAETAERAGAVSVLKLDLELRL